ncbi:hypothetical protein K438DRAFT_2012480 [Mycena galopus ATCC 62051]|nr:hypothetical protein K438DRAFT_2012480 [Mycena galopus ATCC 62051]
MAGDLTSEQRTAMDEALEGLKPFYLPLTLTSFSAVHACHKKRKFDPLVQATRRTEKKQRIPSPDPQKFTRDLFDDEQILVPDSDPN